MQDRPRIRRGIYILPNLFTTASLFAGFLAIIWAAEGEFDRCALAILFSALMDALDGKVARLTNTASEFGVQFDSLADLAAFGLAPGFMVYEWMLKGYERLGIAAAFLFAACSALRLARFNVGASSGASKKFFTGLPTPAAGCAMATLVLFREYVPDIFMGIFPVVCLMTTILLAYLMVSRVRYYAFKEFGFLNTHRFRSMVTAILIFGLVIAAPKILGFLILFGYLVSGLVYTFFILPRKGQLPINKILP